MLAKLKKTLFIFLILLLCFFLPQSTRANDPVNLYFFYSKACPHCAEEDKFLEAIAPQYPYLVIHRFEISEKETLRFLSQIRNQLGSFPSGGVPLTFIGDQAVVGFLNQATTGSRLEDLISRCFTDSCLDSLAKFLPSQPVQSALPTKTPQNPLLLGQQITLPLLGPIDTASVSLPVLTIIVAALDGFNPCAMWVLVFLISLLIGVEDKKKRWLLGSAFIFTSGFVYFLFLSAWLNFFLFIGFLAWVRLAIGLTALTSGFFHLKDYFQNPTGACRVTSSSQKQKITAKLKEVTRARLLPALLGIILLAFAVNLVELVCSAGLPAIYTNILSLSQLSKGSYYLYLLLYILIFVFDDILVFVIAMITLQYSSLTTKYTRLSSLIGGLLITLLGLLLIFKPEWLMFRF